MRTPKTPAGSLSRRNMIMALGALGVSAGTTPTHAASMSQATPEGAADAIAEAAMPDWRFSLVEFEREYQGTITRPEDVPEGLTIVACQVILTNLSDQPMECTVRDIRLRDSEGVEYQAGEFSGDEPRIVSQNLPGGERTRGWVWFGIPEAHEPVSIVFIPPRPVLRIAFEDA